MKILDFIIGLIFAPFNFILNSRLGRLNTNPYLRATIIFLIALAVTAIIVLAYYLPKVL